jgi:GT2 family glycosyltransferase
VTDLAIVIVSYNARADLEQCLESLRANAPAVSTRIVVVDNASSDGSAVMVRARFPEVAVMEAGANLGFAGGTNAGIRASESEYLLFLNPDTVVPPGAVDALVEVLRRRPDVGIVGPRIVDEQGKAELSFGRMVGPLNELRQKLTGALHRRGGAGRVERLSRCEHYADWVSGACLMVRRRDAEAVGLLDERFFIYLEDVDFCAAVRSLGKRVLFTPAAEILHRRGRSVAAAPAATAEQYRRSQVAFYAKHHPRWVGPLRAYLRLSGKHF